jgi:hypothetical protein
MRCHVSEWIVSEYCARQRGSRKSGDDAITPLESPVCPVMMQLLPESSSLENPLQPLFLSMINQFFNHRNVRLSFFFFSFSRVKVY